MEKPTTKSKKNLLKFLPRAASAITFQNAPFSPGRDRRSEVHTANKSKTHLNKGFSGPVISIIPAEARRKPNNNSGFEAPEPTSPKISCIGQIKHKKKMAKQKPKLPLPKEFKPSSQLKNKFSTVKPVSSPAVDKKKPSTIRRIFSGAKPEGGRKSDASAEKFSKLPDRAPNLSQMKRFASSRDAFSNFDWKTAHIAPEDDHEDNRYYSEEEDDDDEVFIPFSAPILVGGDKVHVKASLEPRKEINLWKRRTMAQPQPLKLNTAVRSY